MKEVKNFSRLFFGFIFILAIALAFSLPGGIQAATDSDASSFRLPPEISSNWWATVQDNIRNSEYHVTWQDRTNLNDLKAAYQAPNRAHNLRTYFTHDGIRVIPRTADTPDWEWGLKLTGFGYTGHTQPVAPAKLESNGNRIEYHRGDLTEWYVNDENGLEQGFTLKKPPVSSFETKDPQSAIRNPKSQISVEISLTGNVMPVIDKKGTAIEFTCKDGARVIRYHKLKVLDAAGRELSSHFSLKGTGAKKLDTQSTIVISFNAANAIYPITIDPLATSPNWTAESNQEYANFGWSVATAGDVNGDGYSDVIVGAYKYDNSQTDEGAAFVYHGSSTGLSATAAWTAESDQASALFGCSVATAGDVNGDGYSDVIVGAYYYTNDQTDEGRAFVYHGSSTGLTTGSADWTAEGDQAEAYFGWSVSTAGDVNGDGYSDVIVAALYYTNDQTNEGRAYVYHGSSTGLTTGSADWTAESNQASAFFGHSVSTAGDVNGDGYSDVIVGAPYYTNEQDFEGRAYVYHGSSTGLTTGSADWTAESNQAEARFGHSVSTAGDVNGDGYSDVIIGAYYYTNDQIEEGRAYVYHGSSSGLSTTENWTAEGEKTESYFGCSVSTAGDVNGDGYSDVIVGAYQYDNDQTDEGRAYVYHGSSSGLSTTADWTAETNQASPYFGHSVATAGDVNGDGYSDVIVGAPYYTNDQTDEGRAFVYHGSAAGLATTASWQGESDLAGAYYGISVSTAGDVNGDGFSDVIVGAYYYDNGQDDEGAAFVYHGSASGLATVASWQGESDQAHAYYGCSVSTAGDVNGDGFSDVIVGAYYYDNGHTDEGRAYVYHGSASGLATGASWQQESGQTEAYYGFSVSTAGDVNGDGYSDVIVGAVYYDNGETDEGAAFVYHGSATGLETGASWQQESGQTEARYGYSVSTAGDVNGDGYSDVIVGARYYDNDETDEGAAFVYHGSTSGLTTVASWQGESDQAHAYYGCSVSTAGDVNGDGFSDVIVGAFWYDYGQENEGAAFVYHGSTSGLEAVASWQGESNHDSAWYGCSVSTAGDVNGDGYSDVIVGAPWYDHPTTDEGMAFVYHGSATGLATGAAWQGESDQAKAYYGYSVSTAGDVNGDGYSDVIVGAWQYNNGQIDEGAAFLYYGNGGKGLSLNPRQRQGDDSVPIAHLGMSDDNSFRLALLGRTPYGRGKVKLEWEVKPFGTAFDGTATQKSADWVDTGTAGTEISELVESLSVYTLYHWRVRLLYNPVTTPYQIHSRWLTIPVNGWQEADLSTKGAAGGGGALPAIYLLLLGD